jgi:hypothetical protein
MTRYAHKPDVVEAERFWQDTARKPDGVWIDKDGWYIKGVDGNRVPINNGDWIVRADGEDRVFHVEPEVFKHNYIEIVKG